MGQRHRRLVAASCCIWLLTVVAFVSCQNAPDVAGLRSLATEGDAAAQFDLGDRYFTGEGVPQDNGEALRWFRLAADQGHAGAQFTLGLMYGAGQGVPQDYVTAHQWANLAAAQGHENAREWLDTIAEAISAEQRAARDPPPAPAPSPQPAAVSNISFEEIYDQFRAGGPLTELQKGEHWKQKWLRGLLLCHQKLLLARPNSVRLYTKSFHLSRCSDLRDHF